MSPYYRGWRLLTKLSTQSPSAAVSYGTRAGPERSSHLTHYKCVIWVEYLGFRREFGLGGVEWPQIIWGNQSSETGLGRTRPVLEGERDSWQRAITGRIGSQVRTAEEIHQHTNARELSLSKAQNTIKTTQF